MPSRRHLLGLGLLGGVGLGLRGSSGPSDPSPPAVTPDSVDTVDTADTLAVRTARSRAAGIPTGMTGYEHVGVPVGTSLTPRRSSFTSSADGEVLEFVDLRGLVTINHRDVTIRYCRITSTGDPKIRVNSARHRGASLHLHDCVVRGASDTDHGTAIGYGNYTAERVWVTRCEDAFRLGANATIDTCLTDGQSIARLPNGSRVHTDGVQSTGADNADGVWSTVRNSSLLAVRVDGSKGNSAVILGSEGPRVDGENLGTPTRNILVEGNFFSDGSYSVMQKAPENARGLMENIVFRDNVYAGNGEYGEIAVPRWAVGKYVTFTDEVTADGSRAGLSYWAKSATAPDWFKG
ncbi:hypothetical protein ACFQ46_22010 [Kineococcus sp. GCM10028916]|uniref:hypothetical protein n=1 Tax=Kineococcus sp. GCM10028916 TaxID=3273394 RepID=UPI0036335884